MGLVGPVVCCACGSGLAGGHGSGGFCWVLIAKCPTLRGPTCQGVLGLVFIYLPWICASEKNKKDQSIFKLISTISNNVCIKMEIALFS